MSVDPPAFDEPPPADLIPADDPFVQEQADVALGHLEGHVSAEVLGYMRAELVLRLTTDPRVLRAVERGRRALRVERSGPREKADAGEPPAGKKERAG
jgi:hypothetical protein